MKQILRYQAKVFAITTVLLITFSGVLSAQTGKDTIAIIDAGSSGSRLYVYEVKKSANTVNCIYPADSSQIAGSKGKALSKVPDNRDSVKMFLDVMTAKYDNRDKLKKQLYVLATAGMRLVEETKSTSIYNHMKNVIKTSNNYDVKEAMTISGQYEGLYAWIAANYDKGKLSASLSQADSTYGILEVGGASMQITFLTTSSQRIPDNIQHPKFGNLYSKSYLGGGLNEFNRVIHESDKLPNKDTVLIGLKSIQPFCKDTHFLGIGWAFGGLLTDPVPSGAQNKKEYVQDIRKALSSKEDKEISTEPIETSWTQGATYDIIINQCSPQPYNYEHPN